MIGRWSRDCSMDSDWLTDPKMLSHAYAGSPHTARWSSVQIQLSSWLIHLLLCPSHHISISVMKLSMCGVKLTATSVLCSPSIYPSQAPLALPSDSLFCATVVIMSTSPSISSSSSGRSHLVGGLPGFAHIFKNKNFTRVVISKDFQYVQVDVLRDFLLGCVSS